eukprot:Nk52_evm18s215 gene=Nk52_evmTU18s215
MVQELRTIHNFVRSSGGSLAFASHLRPDSLCYFSEGSLSLVYLLGDKSHVTLSTAECFGDQYPGEDNPVLSAIPMYVSSGSLYIGYVFAKGEVGVKQLSLESPFVDETAAVILREFPTENTFEPNTPFSLLQQSCNANASPIHTNLLAFSKPLRCDSNLFLVCAATTTGLLCVWLICAKDEAGPKPIPIGCIDIKSPASFVSFVDVDGAQEELSLVVGSGKNGSVVEFFFKITSSKGNKDTFTLTLIKRHCIIEPMPYVCSCSSFTVSKGLLITSLDEMMYFIDLTNKERRISATIEMDKGACNFAIINSRLILVGFVGGFAVCEHKNGKWTYRCENDKEITYDMNESGLANCFKLKSLEPVDKTVISDICVSPDALFATALFDMNLLKLKKNAQFEYRIDLFPIVSCKEVVQLVKKYLNSGADQAPFEIVIYIRLFSDSLVPSMIRQALKYVIEDGESISNNAAKVRMPLMHAFSGLLARTPKAISEKDHSIEEIIHCKSVLELRVQLLRSIVEEKVVCQSLTKWAFIGCIYVIVKAKCPIPVPLFKECLTWLNKKFKEDIDLKPSALLLETLIEQEIGSTSKGFANRLCDEFKYACACSICSGECIVVLGSNYSEMILCANGHAFSLCMLTGVPSHSPVFRQCTLCHAKALSPKAFTLNSNSVNLAGQYPSSVDCPIYKLVSLHAHCPVCRSAMNCATDLWFSN